jgi:mRNA interferase RelE/StbE
VSFEIRWLPRSQRDLKKLDPPVRRRVIDAVKQFALDGTGDVVRLVDLEPPEYRLRVGDWRVRFNRDEEHRLLNVLRVLPRGKAYR